MKHYLSLLVIYLNAALGIFSPEILRAQLSTWEAVARPKQLRPADCRKWWNLQAGRGFGKTRAGSEHTLNIMEQWGPHFEGGICSKTKNDVRRDMIEGPSGLLICARRRGYELKYIPSKRVIIHPSGARLDLFSGEVKGDTRGFNGNYFWADELPHWLYAEEAFENIDLALRANAPDPGPHGIITSTPKRRSIISAMLLDPVKASDITTTIGSTKENEKNLEPTFVVRMQRRYGGSWKGDQELDGKFISDNNSGFSKENIERGRKYFLQPQEVQEIVIAIDPAVTSKTTSDDTGCVVVARHSSVDVQMFAVLADHTYTATGPGTWIKDVLEKADALRIKYPCPVKIVIEDNQGGETWDLQFALVAEKYKLWCPEIIRVNARSSKIERADAAGILYEQGRVNHIGSFPILEEQMTQWVPGMDSPDRMDALVHGLLELSGLSTTVDRESWRPQGV